MENTAKNFALQLGALISLYVSVTALIVLLFGIINIAFPDAADSYWRVENYTYQIRFSIATLFVFFPAYLVLTRAVNNIRRREQGKYVALTRWLIYLSLVIAGGVMLGDLVSVILTFLEGEITTRFILKALSMLVVIGLAFYYYVMDAKNYWQSHEKQSVQYGVFVALIVITSLVLGFIYNETPSELRERKLDEKQVTDLRSIQSMIEDYAYYHVALPETLEEAYGRLTIPEPPENRSEYEFNVTGRDTYEICATFAFDSRNINAEYGIQVPTYGSSWEYEEGYWCFERKTEFGEIPAELPEYIR